MSFFDEGKKEGGLPVDSLNANNNAQSLPDHVIKKKKKSEGNKQHK